MGGLLLRDRADHYRCRGTRCAHFSSTTRSFPKAKSDGSARTTTPYVEERRDTHQHMVPRSRTDREPFGRGRSLRRHIDYATFAAREGMPHRPLCPQQEPLPMQSIPCGPLEEGREPNLRTRMRIWQLRRTDDTDERGVPWAPEDHSMREQRLVSCPWKNSLRYCRCSLRVPFIVARAGLHFVRHEEDAVAVAQFAAGREASRSAGRCTRPRPGPARRRWRPRQPGIQLWRLNKVLLDRLAMQPAIAGILVGTQN